MIGFYTIYYHVISGSEFSNGELNAICYNINDTLIGWLVYNVDM